MNRMLIAIALGLIASPALAGTVCVHDPNYGMNAGPFGALARALDGGTRCFNVPGAESQFQVAPSNPTPIQPAPSYGIDPNSLIVGQCYDVNGTRLCRQY
jgi:hypothetical protein